MHEVSGKATLVHWSRLHKHEATMADASCIRWESVSYFCLETKLPEEEKQNLFRINDRKIPKTNSCWVYIFPILQMSSLFFLIQFCFLYGMALLKISNERLIKTGQTYLILLTLNNLSCLDMILLQF